ncbi:MAG TPA: phosphodiester glycosidase family protein [Longimicrobium sp.]
MSRSAPAAAVVRWILAFALVPAAEAVAQTPSEWPVRCSPRTIGGARYRVCEIAPAAVPRIQLTAREAGGRPVRTIARVDSLVRGRGERLLFATNAGLYERVDSATGLLVADGGRTYSRLNRGAGPPDPCGVANFYCPPNGVFFVAGGRAAVLSTADFAARPASRAAPSVASQSGPMLVRGGALARGFAANSRSRKVRNGVGVRRDGSVVFAIADSEVTFRDFAVAFRDAFGCRDALFLDGSISQLYAGPGTRLPPRSGEFAAVFTVTRAADRR